jgi:DNA-binding PadR family transcriptional regulator
MLDFAVLGLLYEAPMHGYELRKQLAVRLGGFRAFSYGSLYPALRRMVRDGLIVEEEAPAPESGPWTRRSRRRVYHLTAEGKERFVEMLADDGPQTWEDDDSFGLHLTFFARTPAETRMRILEGRRRRVEERREARRSALARTGEQIDRYTRELHRQGLDASEREVRWLNELIAHEQAEQHLARRASPAVQDTEHDRQDVSTTDVGAATQETEHGEDE